MSLLTDIVGKIIGFIIAKKLSNDPIIQEQMAKVRESGKIVHDNASKWKALNSGQSWDTPERCRATKTNKEPDPLSSDDKQSREYTSSETQIVNSFVSDPPPANHKTVKRDFSKVESSETRKPKRYVPSVNKLDAKTSMPRLDIDTKKTKHPQADKETVTPKKYIPKT